METIKFALPDDVVPDKIKNMPVCGVIATSIASGRPFSEVWQYYKHASGEKSFNGGLLRSKIKTGLEHFGVGMTEFKDYPKHKCKRFKQVATYLDLLDPKVPYIIFTTKHVQILWGSYVIDQGNKKRIVDYHHRNKRVDEVYAINTNFTL